MVLTIRNATKKDLEQYYELYEKIDNGIYYIRGLLRDYKEKLDLIYVINKDIIKCVSPLLTYPNISGVDNINIQINMLDLDMKMLELITILEYLTRDLENILKDLRKTLQYWKKQLRISGNPISDYNGVIGEISNISNKLHYIEYSDIA